MRTGTLRRPPSGAPIVTSPTETRPWSHDIPDGPWDYIVIGSGMGGMSTAALLAKLGKRVLVLESHNIPGGFTQTFKRPGYRWDVGVHIVGEMSERSYPGRLLRELTDGRLSWESVGPIYDEFNFPDGFTIQFPNSPDAFRATLAEVVSGRTGGDRQLPDAGQERLPGGGAIPPDARRPLVPRSGWRAKSDRSRSAPPVDDHPDRPGVDHRRPTAAGGARRPVGATTAIPRHGRRSPCTPSWCSTSSTAPSTRWAPQPPLRRRCCRRSPMPAAGRRCAVRSPKSW